MCMGEWDIEKRRCDKNIFARWVVRRVKLWLVGVELCAEELAHGIASS